MKRYAEKEMMSWFKGKNRKPLLLERMDGVRFVNEGAMAEQFVGQHLLYQEGCLAKPQLAYWLREGAKGNAEVDFVISSGKTIYPVEVKAGKGGLLKSLRELILAKRFDKAFRFDDNMPERQTIVLDAGGETVEYELVSLPLYAIGSVMGLTAQ